MDFPILYHAHHNLDPEDLDFWLQLASEHSGEILELGCGTGRILIPLAQSGHRIIGLDNDRGMLTVLKDHLQGTGCSTGFIFQADFTAYRLASRFTLILMPCNTFSALTALARRSVLECALLHLAPAGVFAVSLPNPRLLESLPSRSEIEAEDEFPHPLDGEPVIVNSAWERHKNQFIVHWYYDHLLADGKVQRTSVQVKHYLTPVQTYFDEMHAAGFTTFRKYGDYDRSPYSRRSPQLIILASR
jgi:SAM-dependent methyltransferase